MNAVHPTIAAVLHPFAPPQTDAERITILQSQLRKARDEEVSLLRLPFQVEVERKPAVRSWGPMGGEAEYTEVIIDEDLVREAADTILDRHMQEWEALAVELQRMRDDEQREGEA